MRATATSLISSEMNMGGKKLGLKHIHTIEFIPLPPYNFELTVHKPAGWWWSTPTEIYQNQTLWTATRQKNELLGLKLTQTGTTEKPKIQTKIYSKTKLTSKEKEQTEQTLKRALRTEENITNFYKIAKKDRILNQATQDLYGMHSMSWPELLPPLILAITLQMAPLTRSNQMMQLLIENFGDKIQFNQKTIQYWPSQEKLANTSKKNYGKKPNLDIEQNT